MGRLISGFLAVPVVAAAVTVLVAVAGVAIPGVSRMVRASDLNSSAPGTVFVFALVLAAAVTLIGGVPAFGALRRRGQLTLSMHLLMGALLGICPFILLAVVGTIRAASDRELSVFAGTLTRLLADAVVGSVAGAAAAISFFFISSTRGHVSGHAA